MTSETANNRSEQLKASLLDNAFDALASAADAVNRDQGPRSFKEAVLHLVNGVELVLKARIAQEHWTLVFANVDQASYDKIRDGDFVSVDFPKALARLENILGITISKSSTEHLHSLRKMRNKLVHFTSELDSAQTKSLVAKGMYFCIAFCASQKMANPNEEGKLRNIYTDMMKFQEFIDERIPNLLKRVTYKLLWECPECWQKALTIDCGFARCQFCKHNADYRQLASRESYFGVKIEDCPECGIEQTFALALHNNDVWMWTCFWCGEHGRHYRRCEICELPKNFRDSDDVNVCDVCR